MQMQKALALFNGVSLLHPPSAQAVWGENAKWLKVKEVMRFQKCDDCTYVNEQITLTRDVNKIADINKQRADHLAVCKPAAQLVRSAHTQQKLLARLSGMLNCQANGPTSPYAKHNMA